MPKPCTKISESGTAEVQFCFYLDFRESQNPDNTHE